MERSNAWIVARRLGLATIVGAIVFLIATDFFSQWDGVAASARPARTPDPASFDVLIVEEGGRELERAWPADIVREHALRFDPFAIPPNTLDDSLPRTSKLRFHLFFVVSAQGSEPQVVPTTSPTALAMSLVAFLLTGALANMVGGGTPWSIRSRRAYLPPAQSAHGTPSVPRARPQKGPPPSKRGRKRRR